MVVHTCYFAMGDAMLLFRVMCVIEGVGLCFVAPVVMLVIKPGIQCCLLRYCTYDGVKALCQMYLC